MIAGLGACAFFLYPVVILLWNVAEGRAAAARKEAQDRASEAKMDGAAEPKKAMPRGAASSRARSGCVLLAAVAARFQ